MADALRTRLAELLENPDHAEFAQKLSLALDGIRCGFHGEARERLETMVSDALVRQLDRVESRRRSKAALEALETSQAELESALYGVLLRLVPDEGATRH